MKRLIIFCLIYFSCISFRPKTYDVINETTSSIDSVKTVPLLRTDFPDTMHVSRELADRLIKESGGIWIEMKVKSQY